MDEEKQKEILENFERQTEIIESSLADDRSKQKMAIRVWCVFALTRMNFHIFLLVG